jgi:cell division protein FtsW
VLLVLVLIPGVGHVVNGSRRWLGVGTLSFQPSEFMKLGLVIFMAAHLARHADAVRTSLRGFGKPLLLLAGVSALIVVEPDFGSTAVLAVTVLGMLFIAGMRLWPFAALLALVGSALAVLALAAPYRLERLTSFTNPWADPFGSGFQLTQALIAFGRGGWFGVGLGGSVQKLNYLPEAHTDFVFAVLAEELGLFGTLGVIALFALVIARAFAVAWRAERLGHAFAAYLAYGIALWLGLQTLINMGVNMGVLPTKGLTLPLLSYGGSSLVVTLAACALLLRVDYETRAKVRGGRA